MRKFAALALALCVLALPVLALPDSESYTQLSAIPTEGITGATVADSTTATTKISNRAFDPQGNPTVAVSVDFSGSSGDTCVISCLLYASIDGGSTLTFLGLQTATATAGSYVDAAGDNIAPLLFFDTGAATHAEIRNAAPSVGNVDITWWGYGSAPK